jgi:hypothetical protein
MNKGDKKKEEDLKKASDADRAASNAALNTAAQPSALQAMREGELTRWMNWRNSTGEFEGKPFDVMNAPGFAPQLGLYRRAKAGQDAQRMSQGLITMGSNSASPEYVANLKAQRDAQREQDAAGALQESVALRDAEVNQSALPLMELTQSRNMGIAGLRTGQAQQSQGMWAAYRPRPGFWNQMGGAFAQGVGSAAGQLVGGGPAGMKAAFAARGGRIRPGQSTVVGEEGFEYGIDDDGKVRVLGADSPELVRPRKGVTVIPHELSRRIVALRNKPVEQGPGIGSLRGGAALASASQDMGLPDVAPEPDEPGPLRRRIATPPPPVAPADLFTMNTVANTVKPDLAGLDVPTSHKQIGVVGQDVDPREAGMGLRRRVAKPLEFQERRVEDDMVLARPVNRNGRGKSILKALGRGFMRGGIMGAVVGGVAHAVDPSLDEQTDQRRMVEQDVERLGALRRNRADRAALEGAEVDVENKRQRVPLELAKLDATRLQRERANVLAQIRARKGQRFEAGDSLLAQAAALGMHFDADALNDAASNVVAFEDVDPNNPTRKRRTFFNKITGEVGDSFQSGWVAPRDAEGMTAAERAAAGDRTTRLQAELPLIEARIRSTNANTERVLREMETGPTAAALRGFNMEAGDLKARLRGIQQQRAAIERRLAESKALKGDEQPTLDKLDEEERTITSQIEAAKQRAGAGRSAAPPAGAKQRVSRRRFDVIREDNPFLRGKSDAEVEAELKKAGVIIVD